MDAPLGCKRNTLRLIVNEKLTVVISYISSLLHRHPVEWFNSFYNFRLNQDSSWRLDPLDLIGPCRQSHPGRVCAKPERSRYPDECLRHNICTDRSRFHHALSRLKKTSMNSTRELKLLAGRTLEPVSGLKGRIFLIEVKQLSQKGSGEIEFLNKMNNFLKTKNPLRKFLPPETNLWNRGQKPFMDICEDKYAPIRSELLANGKAAAEWIRDYFLKSADVVVAQQGLFLDLLSKWSIDPCHAENTMIRQVASSSP